MKPCSSQKLLETAEGIFGYRLFRTRSTTKNAFGILSDRFRVLSSRLYLQPNNVTKIKLACCVLHNILRTHSKNSYSPIGFADEVEENGNKRWGQWRDRNNWQCNP